MRAGAAWEHYLNASLVEARTLSGAPECATQSFAETFSDDDLTAEEFVDLEVALGDVPIAQPVAGAPLEDSRDAVVVAERIPLFTEYDRSTRLRFLRKLCLYFVCCPCALGFLLRRCLPPCLKKCWEVMGDVVHYVCCVPLVRCCDAVGRCCAALGRAIRQCCAAAHRIFVVPIVKVIRKCCNGAAYALSRCYAAVGAAVGVCCRAIRRIVVKPLVECCAAICRQIARGCNAVGRCCTCICRSVGKCCNWVGEHVVTPLRNCVLAVMYGVYDHIMAPLGRGIYAVAAAIYAVAARVGLAIYGIAAGVSKSMYDVVAGVAAAMYDVAAAVANAAYGVAEALGNAINGTGHRP